MKQPLTKTLAHAGGLAFFLFVVFQGAVMVKNWAYNSTRDYFYGQIDGYFTSDCSRGIIFLTKDKDGPEHAKEIINVIVDKIKEMYSK